MIFPTNHSLQGFPVSNGRFDRFNVVRFTILVLKVRPAPSKTFLDTHWCDRKLSCSRGLLKYFKIARKLWAKIIGIIELISVLIEPFKAQTTFTLFVYAKTTSDLQNNKEAFEEKTRIFVLVSHRNRFHLTSRRFDLRRRLRYMFLMVWTVSPPNVLENCQIWKKYVFRKPVASRFSYLFF